MAFENQLNALTVEIAAAVSCVYHLSMDDAQQMLRKSDFYRLLADEQRGLWRDGAEVNFHRYQNEIEYGAWNRNEFGGIVE